MIIIDKYTALNMEDYNDVISLVEGWVGREQDFRPNWSTREFGKAGAKVEKKTPVRVKLGSPAKVIEVALYLLKEMTGKDYAPVGEPTRGPTSPPPDIDDEIPF